MRDLRSLPGLHYRRLLSLWKTSLSNGKVMPLSVDYDAMQVNDAGSRLRGFKIRQRETVKIVLRNSRYGDATLRELEARKDILANSTLKIPTIFESNIGEDYINFREEMLHGRAYNNWIDSRDFFDQVGGPLVKLYFDYGITHKPLSETLGAVAAQKISASMIDDAHIKDAQKLLSRNPEVAVSVAHCDLVASNMVVTGKGIHVIDWEKCQEQYLGYDFARLALRYPHNPYYRHAAEKVFGDFQAGRLTLEEADTIKRALSTIRDFGKRG